MDNIETAEDARWALPFHKSTYEMRTKKIKKVISLILFDIAMAKHLILAEEYFQALSLNRRYPVVPKTTESL